MARFRLAPDDPAPVRLHHAERTTPALLVCDHASNAVPACLAGLGLSAEELGRHIGWDIGAAAVTRRLADALDAVAVLAGYSRLVIDCNRDPGDATSIPEISDGVRVPANRDLAPAERQARRDAIFVPYHDAVDGAIAALLGRGAAPALIAIHSFTPVMGGTARPWHVGILWDEDPRIAVPLLETQRADPALAVGDNEPYSAREPQGFTVRHHAVARGLPHVAIELRQDLVGAEAGAAAWAQRLAAALAPILARLARG